VRGRRLLPHKPLNSGRKMTTLREHQHGCVGEVKGERLDRLTCFEFIMLKLARTCAASAGHSGFAKCTHSTSGPSKSVARNFPCSRTSHPLVSGSR